MGFFETLLKMVLIKMGVDPADDGSGQPANGLASSYSGAGARADIPAKPVVPVPSKYHILVAALNGDDDTHSVRAEVIRHLSLLPDCDVIAESNSVEWQMRDDAFAALLATHAQADKYRLAGQHDVIVWGSVDKAVGTVSLYLSHENGLSPSRLARSAVPVLMPVARLKENAATIESWAMSALLADAQSLDDRKTLAAKLNQIMVDLYAGLSHHLTTSDGQQACKELISASTLYAGSALDLAQEGVPDHLSEALGLVNICAILSPPEDQPVLVGCEHAVRGELCLRVQSVSSDHDIEAAAQESLRTALEKLSQFPAAATLCAMLQFGLGRALYLKAAETDDTEMLAASMSAFKKASAGISVQQYPFQWSQIMAQLGTALLKLGEFQKEPAPIEQAVLVFQGALRAMPRNERIAEWAKVQFSLAMALFTLGKMEKNSEHFFNSRIAFNEAAGGFQEADSKRSARMARNYAEKAQLMREEYKDIIKAAQ